MRARAEIAKLAQAMFDYGANAAPMPGVFPDYAAPIVTRAVDGARVMRDVRWGMPSSKKAILDAATKRADKARAKGQVVDFAHMLRMEPDGGTTNVRNTASSHWRPWLGFASRCLVPFTSFSEPDRDLQDRFVDRGRAGGREAEASAAGHGEARHGKRGGKEGSHGVVSRCGKGGRSHLPVWS
jgi:putative SOS response-associated peptidase YedK